MQSSFEVQERLTLTSGVCLLFIVYVKVNLHLSYFILSELPKKKKKYPAQFLLSSEMSFGFAEMEAVVLSRDISWHRVGVEGESAEVTAVTCSSCSWVKKYFVLWEFIEWITFSNQ